jgi:periplasmic protein TonB
MDDSIIYRKTRRGATELAATHGTLSPTQRRVLILLNGERTLADLADLFGSESVEHIVADLEAQGFARQVNPEEIAETTQSVPTQFVPILAADFRPTVHQPPPARRGSAWAVLGLFVASAVLAAGYWLVWRPHRVEQVAIAAVRPPEVDRASVSLASAEPGLTQVDSQAAVRELPLSGLPAVTVTSATKAAVARGGAAAETPEDTVAVVPASASAIAPPGADVESVAPGRRPTERPAPAPPNALPTSAPAAKLPPAELAPAPATSAPAPTRAVSAPAASAANTRIEQTALDAPAAETPRPAPAPIGERQTLPTLAAAGPVPVAAAMPAAASTSSPPAGTAPSSPSDQIAALAPPAVPRSGPVQLHPRKHDPPEYPPRALRSRILEGHVVARLYVTPEGKVDQVDVVKATPPRVFDDAVKRALSGWTFDPPGRPVDTTVELNFKQ